MGHLSDMRQEDWLALFFLCLYVGAYAFPVLIAAFLRLAHGDGILSLAR
jgi:hypothetical protein